MLGKTALFCSDDLNGVQEVAGSNPVAPTRLGERSVVCLLETKLGFSFPNGKAGTRANALVPAFSFFSDAEKESCPDRTPKIIQKNQES